MNFKIQKITGLEIGNRKDLQRKVLQLDEINMAPILRESGIDTIPWEKRKKNLLGEFTIIYLALDGESLIGYSEFSYKPESKTIYLSSIQTVPQFRNSVLFKKLVLAVFNTDEVKNSIVVKSNVQKTNVRMVRIFEKLGFSVIEGESKSTLVVEGKYEIVAQSKFFQKLLRV